MSTYIVLLGPPGVGKGTQAKIIAEKTGLPHVSSGDLFRENIKNETDLGKLAQNYINKGELVPDNVTIAMIHTRLSQSDCKGGALLDGFPRTPAQADALAQMLADFGGRVEHVPYITASAATLVERLSGRWTCRSQGHIYHQITNPSKKPGVCDVDGSELYQRDDDKVETVMRRIQVYLEQTAPLISYYRQCGVLDEVDGERPVDEVTASIMAVLQSA